MRKAVSVLCTIIILSVIWLLLFNGDSKIVDSTWFQSAYDNVNYALAHNQHLFRPATAKPSNRTVLTKLNSEDIKKLQEGKILVLTGEEAILAAKNQSTWRKLEGAFIVVANVPREYHRRSPQDCLGFTIAVSHAAMKLGAKAIIECSAPDISRLNPDAAAITQEMHKAGIIRLVIFDGGHHLASLALVPNLLLVPVLKDAQGQYWAGHSYTRDAMKLGAILAIIKNNNLPTQVLTFPRMASGVKTKKAMGELARQALIEWPFVITAKDYHAQILTNPGLSLLPNGTLLMSGFVSDEDDAKNFAAKVEFFVKKYRAKKVELGITWGDLNIPTGKAEKLQEQLTKKLMQYSKKTGLLIDMRTVPYSVRQLYWKKLVGILKSP